MTQPDLVNCHCIIGHPSKAKFLAIKHASSWGFPTLKIPRGRLDYRSLSLSQEMQRKYGLDTRVLRPVISSPDYNCIEMELTGKGSNKNIKAVWVGMEQYQEFRSERTGNTDPFEQWLLEKEQDQVPALRPPWQFPGWHKKADHWIHFQLDKLGRQVTGAVQQHRVGWNASCLLRVPTTEGRIYFKAGYAKPPREARITSVLADKWPQHIISPLAADLERNWMLNEDFEPAGSSPPEPAMFPGFLHALAVIQIGSMDCMQEWDALGCPRNDLDYLLARIEHKEEFLPYLQEGDQKLEDKDLEIFMDSLSGKAEICHQLKACGIPDSLIHKDFRSDNLVNQNGAFRIFDWTDVVIGHPFFSLDRVLSSHGHASTKTDQEKKPSFVSSGDGLIKDIKNTYLDAFLPFAPMAQLEEALKLCGSLSDFWGFCGIRNELDWVEKGSPDHYLRSVQLQNAARWMIGRPIPGQ